MKRHGLHEARRPESSEIRGVFLFAAKLFLRRRLGAANLRFTGSRMILDKNLCGARR
jgi:hypothetical protein